MRAPLHRADVSPIVSVAETRYTATTERRAPMFISGVKGRICGMEKRGCSVMPLRFTMPMREARIYPTISPTRTERERIKPLAKT